MRLDKYGWKGADVPWAFGHGFSIASAISAHVAAHQVGTDADSEIHDPPASVKPSKRQEHCSVGWIRVDERPFLVAFGPQRRKVRAQRVFDRLMGHLRKAARAKQSASASG